MRKEKGKRDQRRNYKEESSAPKRRRLQEGYEENRTLTINTKYENRTVPATEHEIDEIKRKRRKKNQTLIEKFFNPKAGDNSSLDGGMRRGSA